MKKTKHHKLRNYPKSSTNERNIILSDRVKPYRVVITRDSRTFTRYVDSIEEGVKTRDAALQFYDSYGRLPENFDELQSKDREFPKFGRCSRCDRSVEFNSIGAYHRFHNSNDLCSYCQSDRRREQSNFRSVEMRQILWIEKIWLYLVTFQRREERLTLYQASLEDAKLARDKIEKFYEENFRLPTRKEVIEDLKIDVLRLPKSDDLKNIATVNDGRSYVAYLTRNGVRHSRTFKDLDSAKIYRDFIYEFYEKSHRLPTKEEANDKVKQIISMKGESLSDE